MTGGTVINENEACSVVRTTGEYVFDDFRVNVSVSEAGADPVADAKSLAREGIAAFSSEALTLPFLLRGWQNGDWMRPVGLNGKKKLSDIFTGLRLSIEEKSRALVIVLPGLTGEGRGEEARPVMLRIVNLRREGRITLALMQFAACGWPVSAATFPVGSFSASMSLSWLLRPLLLY